MRFVYVFVIPRDDSYTHRQPLNLSFFLPSTARGFYICWQHSVGGGYFGYAWRIPAVQRLKRQTHVGTIASTGAANSGEMELQCQILGLLQRGCLGNCALQGDDGTTRLHEVHAQQLNNLVTSLYLVILCLKGVGSKPSQAVSLR